MKTVSVNFSGSKNISSAQNSCINNLENKQKLELKEYLDELVDERRAVNSKEDHVTISSDGRRALDGILPPVTRQRDSYENRLFRLLPKTEYDL